jgi:hypothetical protein
MATATTSAMTRPASLGLIYGHYYNWILGKYQTTTPRYILTLFSTFPSNRHIKSEENVMRREEKNSRRDIIEPYGLMGLGLIFVFCLLRVCIPDRIWVCVCCLSTDWSIKVNRRSLLMVLASVIPNGTHHHTRGYRLYIGSGDCERRVISYH